MKVGFAYGIVGDISFAQRYSFFSTGVDIAYYGGKLKYTMSTGDSTEQIIPYMIIISSIM